MIFDMQNLQAFAIGASFGLAMIRPSWAANGNVPRPPDPGSNPDPEPPKAALKVPNTPLKDVGGHFDQLWLNPDPMYGGKYIDAAQFAHKFALWMVEAGHTDWQTFRQVDRKMVTFCKLKGYCYPDRVDIRARLAGMLKDNYKPRAWAKSAQFRHLHIYTENKERIAVYRFTPALARHLTKEPNALAGLQHQFHTDSSVVPWSHGSEPGSSPRNNVSRNKKRSKRLTGISRNKRKTPIKTAHYLDGCPFEEAA